MSRTSHTLIAAMPTVLDFTGAKIPAAGWYGHTKGWHSFAISVHNFQGRIFLQGAQALDPGDADWFALPCPAPYDILPYIEYPRPIPPPLPGASPLGPPPFGPQRNPNLRNGETSTIGFTLRTNCLWLRAMIRRDYLQPVVLPAYGSQFIADAISWLGLVDTILVNY